MRVALVGCGKDKRATPAEARDLYTGALFRLARRWAERHADRWLILSAKHGLLEPHRLVAPYNAYLPALARDEREAWGVRVSAEIRRDIPAGAVLVLLAGAEYGARIDVPNAIERPLEGLGIGQRLRWLKQNT